MVGHLIVIVSVLCAFCHGTEYKCGNSACANQTITCADTTCTFDCKRHECENSIFICTIDNSTYTTECEIDCKEAWSCSNLTILSSTTTQIHCKGNNSCHNLLVNISNFDSSIYDSIEISASGRMEGSNSFKNGYFYCGGGLHQCELECFENENATCSDSTFECGLTGNENECKLTSKDASAGDIIYGPNFYYECSRTEMDACDDCKYAGLYTQASQIIEDIESGVILNGPIDCTCDGYCLTDFNESANFSTTYALTSTTTIITTIATATTTAATTAATTEQESELEPTGHPTTSPTCFGTNRQEYKSELTVTMTTTEYTLNNFLSNEALQCIVISALGDASIEEWQGSIYGGTDLTDVDMSNISVKIDEIKSEPEDSYDNIRRLVVLNATSIEFEFIVSLSTEIWWDYFSTYENAEMLVNDTFKNKVQDELDLGDSTFHVELDSVEKINASNSTTATTTRGMPSVMASNLSVVHEYSSSQLQTQETNVITSTSEAILSIAKLETYYEIVTIGVVVGLLFMFIVGFIDKRFITRNETYKGMSFFVILMYILDFISGTVTCLDSLLFFFVLSSVLIFFPPAHSHG